MKPKPEPLPCRVVGCSRPGMVKWVRDRGRRCWQRRSLCAAHEKRKTRLGSTSARRCSGCHAVVSDEHDETERLGREPGWRCLDCLLRRSA